MKFAATMPALLYPIFDSVSQYHLAQAHHIVEHDNVMKWFDAASRDGHMVIIDNGVIELGGADIDALRHVATRVEVDIMICPDVFNDKDKSIDQFEKYFEECSQMAGHVMCVPHGQTVAECVECALKMYDIMATTHEDCGCLMFGIPKVMDHIELHGREKVIRQIMSAHEVDPIRFHLLGAWDSLEEMMRTNLMIKGLIGGDSTLPIAYGLHGEMLVNPYMPKRFIDRWDIEPEDISVVKGSTIVHNILAVQRWMNL